tara:strand:- start:1212 stop:2114 length:903 start_codon:yes stop_codon:yes gene_type:complete
MLIIMSELYVQMTDNDNEENNQLCENMDCRRFPPDWDFDKDTEESYEEGQWQKCSLCIGYFNDDGVGDILFIEEEPNNQSAECDLCGKTKNIVQMKGTGQYICQNACDESDEEESEEEEEEESEEETNKCNECNTELDRYRDGSIDKDIRCNNCYWEDKEGKQSLKLIKPDYREFENRYVVCDNCSEKIDCWNCNIYCLYKGDRKNPSEEITVCVPCIDDLTEEFKQEGYKCDDWDDDDDDDDDNEEFDCVFNYYICRYCEYVTINDDPDCNKCKKKVCMEMFQAENQSAALYKKHNGNK